MTQITPKDCGTPRSLAVILNAIFEKLQYELPDGDFVTDTALATALADYPTSAALATALADYPTSAALATALADYITDTALATALADYPTSTALATALADYLPSQTFEAFSTPVVLAATWSVGAGWTQAWTSTNLTDAIAAFDLGTPVFLSINETVSCKAAYATANTLVFVGPLDTALSVIELAVSGEVVGITVKTITTT